jgi:hypothetical protein
MTAIRTPFTLFGSVFQIDEYAYWELPDYPDDPLAGRAYQWEITVAVNPQIIGDKSGSGSYTEDDIQLGDWITLTVLSPSTTLQIVGITSRSNGIIVMVVEDVDRYNLYLRGMAGGISNPNEGFYDALIYRLSDEGYPIFVGVKPQDVVQDVLEEINSRFKYRNYLQNNVRVYQENNGFDIGDELSLDAYGVYSKAVAQGLSAYKVVGQVKDINIPGPGWFTFQPNGKLVRYLSPNLPGNSGDVIYLNPSNAGKLTATRPTSGIAVPVFIKLDDTTGIKVAGIINGGLDNFSATAAPTTTDDTGDGYSYGSLWVDRTNKTAYINVYPNAGQSIWQKIGGDVPVASDTVLGSVKIGENINVTTEGVISVTKGAGINKIGDIPDVYTYGVTSGSLLVYNSGANRWDAQPSLSNISLDGGEF